MLDEQIAYLDSLIVVNAQYGFYMVKSDHDLINGVEIV